MAFQDKEAGALSQILDLLSGLPADAQQRVMTYVASRISSGTTPSPRAAATAAATVSSAKGKPGRKPGFSPKGKPGRKPGAKAKSARKPSVVTFNEDGTPKKGRGRPKKDSAAAPVETPAS